MLLGKREQSVTVTPGNNAKELFRSFFQINLALINLSINKPMEKNFNGVAFEVMAYYDNLEVIQKLYLTKQRTQF